MTPYTIFARATGTGRAAIAVLRVSGPDASRILVSLCGVLPQPRRATLRALRSDGEVLDRALVLWLPGPNSYTGEDGAELHVHAGPAVVEAVADTLVRLGARPAEPGEFTRRAFGNGRLDLLEAEGIADLVEAETQAQRRQALLQADGALSRLYDAWAGRLRVLLAHAEALIDFPDEDLPPEIDAALLSDTAGLADEMRAHLRNGAQGERIRDGLVVAIAGPPNVGKSSLLNRLAERDAAMVSDIAGTTRDAIEVRLVLADVPVTLVDTAGVRKSNDPLEQEGVRRALRHAERADLVMRVACVGVASEGDGIRVWNKCDLAPAPEGWLAVSAQTGIGLEALRAHLSAEVARLTDLAGAAPLTRARHRAGIAEALEHLEDASRLDLPELRGEALRLAMQALGRLTGRIGVEDLLDTVFNQFCIGK